jgi:hypothetical protein
MEGTMLCLDTFEEVFGKVSAEKIEVFLIGQKDPPH